LLRAVISQAQAARDFGETEQMQFEKDFYENWNAHNHTTSQNDEDDDQHNGFPKMKDPNRRKTRGGGGASPL
jgi:hypothetical protein